MKAKKSPFSRAARPLLISSLAVFVASSFNMVHAQKSTSNAFGPSATDAVNDADYPLKAQTATLDTRAINTSNGTQSSASPMIPSSSKPSGTAIQTTAAGQNISTPDLALQGRASSASSSVAALPPASLSGKSRLYPSGYNPNYSKPIIGGEHRALPAMSMALSDQVNCFGERRPEVASMVGLSRVVHVRLLQALESNNVAVGNPVIGVLTEDFALGTIVIAPAGATITGHIQAAEVARTLANSFHDPTRRFKSRGMIVIKFDEILDKQGNAIPIIGSPVRQKEVQEGHGRRETRVDRRGRIVKAEPTLTPNRQRLYNAGRIATMAPIPGNVLFVNLVGIPTTMAVAGGADPSFAYNKPMEDEVQSHKREKAFVYAFVTSLPGAPVVQAYVEKGNEVELHSGDVLAVNLMIDSRNGRQIKKADEQLASARLYPADSSVTGMPLPGAPIPGSAATAQALLDTPSQKPASKLHNRQTVRGEVLPTTTASAASTN